MTTLLERPLQEETPIEQTERQALAVLTANDRGDYTVPNVDLYHGQWLWDSAFIAVGLRHYMPERAGLELTSLLRGQWQDGMIPNIIYEPNPQAGRLPPRQYLFDWSRRGNRDNAPSDVRTSGITQPPLLADAARLVGEKLPTDDRRDFLRAMVPGLINYHRWIYQERNFGKDDLFAAVHPWETGMDNTPVWIDHMQTLDWGRSQPIDRWLAEHAQGLRADTKLVDSKERSSKADSVQQILAQLSLIRNHYQAERLADEHPLHVQDVLMNSALIHNNRVLVDLATEVDLPVDDELRNHMAGTETNFEKLWNEADGTYYARDAVSGKQLRPATVASLIALYSGAVPENRAQRIADDALNPTTYNGESGLATVSAQDPHYGEQRYWSGANWISTSWLLAEGLKRYDFDVGHKELVNKTIRTIVAGGMREYFSSKTGRGYGIDNFSWTAALYLDLMAAGSA